MKVTELQYKLGVTADGIIGRKTLSAFMKKYKKTAHQTAVFLSNIQHETANFTKAEESLYYSTPERIRAVWPARFPTVNDAKPYAKNPKALANKVYNGRMGNKIGSNDGWNFRGRGALQLTGRENYEQFAEYTGDATILINPEKVATEYFWESAFFFFDKNKVWECKTITDARKKINGGYIGLEEVTKLYKKYLDLCVT